MAHHRPWSVAPAPSLPRAGAGGLDEEDEFLKDMLEFADEEEER